MPFVPALDCINVEFIMVLDTVRWECNMWFQRGAGSPSIVDVTNLVNLLHGEWNDDVMPLLSTNVQHILTVGKMHNSPSDLAASNGVGGTFGGILESFLPTFNCVCVHFGTGLSGRGYQGRTYVSGIPLSKFSGNSFDVEWGQTLADGIQAVALAAAGIGWQQVIVSRQFNNAPRTTAVVTVVTEWSLKDDFIDVQRRRKIGVGT